MYTQYMGEETVSSNLHRKVLKLRQSQFQIHQVIYKEGTRIPIHFAFGHEAIAAALTANLLGQDKLLLSHRNIHYHLALGAKVEDLLAEYRLEISPVSGKRLGSMNLDFTERGAIYTSNILGNNLSVATGIALGSKLKEERAATWCVTGDGAIEEGAFYESLLLSVSRQLAVIFVVENNRWSLASEVTERRSELDLNLMARSIGVKYKRLSGNNVVEYESSLNEIRKDCVDSNSTFIVEVELSTLGGFYIDGGESTRYVNYHAGKVQDISLAGGVMELSNNDPAWVSENYIKESFSETRQA